MNNKIIIEKFKLLLDYTKKINKLEEDPKIKNNNKFRIKNFTYALDILSSLSYNLTIENLKDFFVPGIGTGIINRINEILLTKHLKELDDLEKLVNKSTKQFEIVNELNDIINIGDIKAIELIKKFNIKSVKDLNNKVNNGTIQVSDKIKMGLKYYGKYKTHIPRLEIDKIYIYLDKIISAFDKSYIFFICGSYRRGNKFPNDIDILLIHLDVLEQKDVKNSTYLSKIINILKENKFIIDDLTDVNNDTKYMGFCKYKNSEVRRIDIRMVGIKSLIPAIVYFTGSYELNRLMRKNAKKLNYRLNEYELLDLKTNKPIILTSEKQLFDILNMTFLQVNERNI
jgi:DNA polymerase/3'-5' exonuclease PolX